MLEKHFACTLYLHKLLVISPQSLVLKIQRSMNYRTINIEINIFFPNHRIINRIVKFPLSHSLNLRNWQSVTGFYGKKNCTVQSAT
jgi:hypothetical protein